MVFNNLYRVNGAYAENLVTSILRIYGLSIIARNVSFKFTELDIIASYRDVLYIVEVRKRSNLTDPNTIISYKKIYKVIRAGHIYFYTMARIYNVHKVLFYLAIVNKDYNIRFINFVNLI